MQCLHVQLSVHMQGMYHVATLGLCEVLDALGLSQRAGEKCFVLPLFGLERPGAAWTTLAAGLCDNIRQGGHAG